MWPRGRCCGWSAGRLRLGRELGAHVAAGIEVIPTLGYNATLRLQLAGQDLVMDFPNHRVGCEVELIEALERVPGVGRVFER